MSDATTNVSPREAWGRQMARIGEDHGFFHRLGKDHAALFVKEGDTLVVSFDRADRLWDKGAEGLPLGFDCVVHHEWSALCILSAGRTWFRGKEIEEALYHLAGNGFFLSYKRVIILASGPDCGHAAARAAALIPSASVFLCQPAAAVSALNAPFETRFDADRRRGNPDFPGPIGPEALERAAQTFVLFDPTVQDEAAQAALFRARDTNRVSVPFAGPALDRALRRRDVLVPLTKRLAADRLEPSDIRIMLRPALRADTPYLGRRVKSALARG